MAQLMGKNLGHQDLIWVVPCVRDFEYPTDRIAEPMKVTILGNLYEVQVQYHTLRNITYVLLDAPVFRQQTKAEPYPPRMDDLESAIYYSAWNQCIALAIKRFPIDLYHINDVRKRSLCFQYKTDSIVVPWLGSTYSLTARYHSLCSILAQRRVSGAVANADSKGAR